jgi:hypothetical protein
MAAILCALCTQRVQVSLGSFLPSLAMQEIADSPPTRTDGNRIYQTRPRLVMGRSSCTTFIPLKHTVIAIGRSGRKRGTDARR